MSTPDEYLRELAEAELAHSDREELGPLEISVSAEDLIAVLDKLRAARETLRRIAEGAGSNPASELADVARAALESPQ